MTTSRDIAAKAGVSQATVSRVLQDHPGVTAKTREKVLRVIDETNYRPNAIARAMRTRKTGMIGVVVARITNPLYPIILDILNRKLSERGLKMIVWDSEGSGEEAAIQAIQQSLMDGIIFTTARSDSKSLSEAVRCGIPTVLLNRTVDTVPFDQIESDNVDGGEKVAEYFCQYGRRRIGLVTGPNDASTIRQREQGFHRGLARFGRMLEPSLTVSALFDHWQVRNAMKSLLELSEPPDAVFCVNDVIAFGALDAARERNLRVPEDLWIVGFDDVDMSSWATLSLTTVRQPVRRMVDAALSRLIVRMGDTDDPQQLIQLPINMVIRGTTGFAPFPRRET